MSQVDDNMRTFQTEVNIGLEDIAVEISNLNSHKDVIEFIMQIDEYVCDFDFTKKLIKRLQDSLSNESAA